MKVKFTRNTVAAQQPVFIGNEMELDDNEARRLILMGRAVAVTEKENSDASVDPSELQQSQSIEQLDAPDEKPKAKGKKGK